MADERVDLWVTPQPAAVPQHSPGQTAPQPVAPVAAAASRDAVLRQSGSVQAPQHLLGTLPLAPTPGVLWWALGVHGGAGVSTLLRTIGGGGDPQRHWPDIHGAASDVHVVLVARTDHRGLTAAQAALQEWHSGLAPTSTNIVGLVLMADAPTKPPRPIRDRIRVLTGAVSQSWEVPWIEEWREGGKSQKRVKSLDELEGTLRGLTQPRITYALPPGPSGATQSPPLVPVTDYRQLPQPAPAYPYPQQNHASSQQGFGPPQPGYGQPQQGHDTRQQPGYGHPSQGDALPPPDPSTRLI
ncbi:hypothetical protein NX794_23615 [Streptomyces sp. LP11]|uniref:Uncharacterized protein n=1 Tax=Streptomyces pyxinicus TaxID=2970331 RepID=A0ABT2B6N3_9ACTN|nr:DUF6668 family protein [Streptomyces sp. LP11]MCS0604178.1 hypothetical protein [Streptomyces sp. LP11]